MFITTTKVDTHYTHSTDQRKVKRFAQGYRAAEGWLQDSSPGHSPSPCSNPPSPGRLGLGTFAAAEITGVAATPSSYRIYRGQRALALLYSNRTSEPLLVFGVSPLNSISGKQSS